SDGCLGPRMSRREAIRRALTGAAGLCLAESEAVRAWAATTPAKATGKAKSVIEIWMWGGPSHLDTFDPKPEAGNDYCGPYTKPIETNVPGLRIGEMLPLLAKQADKYAIIRGMTHGSNAHETATYMVQTGRNAGERLVYPCVGAVVSFFKGYHGGYRGQLPPYVVLTEPQGRTSEGGFLGAKYKPFATGGDPAQTPFAVEGIVAPGITDQQQRQRREWLDQLNTLRHATPTTPAMKILARSEDEAYDMILGDGAKVFDLSTEKDELRERYGKIKFGQSCLMARRLVEQGVPYITINYPGWDTHKNHFQTMRTKLPELDKGMATLLQDLAERGLLDRTVVWWAGEFGRTPKIQWEAPYNGGRGHWGSAFSVVVAGGGFKGGRVVGSSDARGETVKDRPTSPADLIASIYNRLGIATDAQLPQPDGTGVPATSAGAASSKTGGPLAEIM
ncbi:MAG: DUF1501 domain-containing protein, partial [Verrucomicrobia bacterium]|nr:DUF1501 domain-containing protein [Verrucomicrobiota bacterium]